MKTEQFGVEGVMVRVQYTPPGKSPTSLTIDALIFNALERKFGDAKKWCRETAIAARNELMSDALKLEEEGNLKRPGGRGKMIDMTPEEFIKGKVSGRVRHLALIQVLDPTLKKRERGMAAPSLASEI
jgi:hypothetical protein